MDLTVKTNTGVLIPFLFSVCVERMSVNRYLKFLCLQGSAFIITSRLRGGCIYIFFFFRGLGAGLSKAHDVKAKQISTCLTCI